MFRTSFNINPSPFQIGHDDKILSLGSCFAQNMGQRLEKLKFNIQNNPFGIIYNPKSIASSLERLQNKSPFSKEDLFFHNECWHSWAHHGSFSNPELSLALDKINNRQQQVPHQIDTLIITFGSAYAYRLKATGQIVANCHKIPNKQFDKIRLSANEIAETLLEQIHTIQSQQTNLKTILTVSPVRHIKDGILDNQRSKAILLLACEQIEQQLPNSYYFPSYEIMMDDLRDYRFYASDMLHPNQQAQDYIWEKFSDTFFTSKTKQTINAIEKLNQSIEHRPLYPETKAHQKFLNQLLNKIEALGQQYPKFDFSKEKQRVKEQLN